MCCGAAILMAGVGAFLTSAIVAASLAVPGGPAAAAAAGAVASCACGVGDSRAAAAFVPGLSGALGNGALLLEHGLLLALSAYAAASFASSRRGGNQAGGGGGQESEPHATLKRLNALVARVRSLAGPPAVLEWPEVKPAPPATMDVDRLREGEAVSHHDARGAIYRFKIDGGVAVNMYFTKAGHMRSGDLHQATQYDVVLKGRVRLTMRDPTTGADVTAEYGEHEVIVIPPRWPHVFEFLEDNCLLEWWDAPFEAWYYSPYRGRMEARAAELRLEGEPGAALLEHESNSDGREAAKGGPPAIPSALPVVKNEQ